MLTDPVELLVDHHSPASMASHMDLRVHKFIPYRTILIDGADK